MSLHVRAEVGPVGESLTAVRAAVRLLAGVRPQVALQQPRPRELLTAYAAAVRQFVSQQVHGQCGHADVSLAAGNALLCRLRVQASVGLLVPRQVAGGGVLLPAFGADVAVFDGVGVRGTFHVDLFVLIVFHDLVEFLEYNGSMKFNMN